MTAGDWKTGFVSHGPCQLEYKYKDQPGKSWLVFLHGFGQDYRVFEPLYAVEEKDHSLLAIHLFFHGESTLAGKEPLRPEDLNVLIRMLFRKLEIEKAHWVAYSMGAKFTLFSYQEMPELFSAVTLLAPDGVVMNPWYGFATQTRVGRFVLRLLLRDLPMLRHVVVYFGKLGLVRPSLGRFAEGQMGTKRRRELVLNVWLRFREIWPKEAVWRSQLQNSPLPFTLVLGKYDTIIPKERFRQKQKEWKEVRWMELSAGHASLVEKFGEKLDEFPDLFAQ